MCGRWNAGVWTGINMSRLQSGLFGLLLLDRHSCPLRLPYDVTE